MADKRLTSLGTSATKDLAASTIVDKSGYSEAKQQTLNVQRVFANTSQDSSGDSTPAIDFTNYEHIDLLIDRDSTITITMPERTKCYLRISKGTSDLVSFYSVTVDDGMQYGLGTLIYELVKLDSTIYAKRVNRQTQITKTSGNLTSSYGTITDFDRFKVFTEGNIANVNGHFYFTPSSARDNYTISIASLGLQFKDTVNDVSCRITVTGSDTLISASGVMSASSLILNFESNLSTSNEYDIYISGVIPIN